MAGKALSLAAKSAAAGLAISLGAALNSALCKAGFPELGALAFSAGLLCVLAFGLALFTGAAGWLPDSVCREGLSEVGWFAMSAVCGLCAAFAAGWACRAAGMPGALPAFSKADSVTSAWQVALRSMGAGAMVALAVKSYKTAKAPWLKGVGVIVPIFAMVYLGMRHSVASAFAFGMAGDASWEGFGSIVLQALGNSVGAMCIVLLLEGFKAGAACRP